MTEAPTTPVQRFDFRSAGGPIPRQPAPQQAPPQPAAPSFLKQTKWPTGVFNIPGQGVNFNCSIARWRGMLWLVTRNLNGGRNSICIHELPQGGPRPGFAIRLPALYNNEQYEDPRICCNGLAVPTLPILSYCTYVSGKSAPHQVVATLTEKMEATNLLHVEYRNNGNCISSNKGPEKNWVFFKQNEALHFVYGTHPHEVVELLGHRVFRVHKTQQQGLQWPWGQLRGGTPPVLIGNEYLSFFHSSSPYRNTSRYYMGAYTFEAQPPFAMTRISKAPILMGSEEDPHMTSPPYVIYPGGAVFENNEWFVVFGVNDCRCGWIRIPHEDLLATLTPVTNLP